MKGSLKSRLKMAAAGLLAAMLLLAGCGGQAEQNAASSTEDTSASSGQEETVEEGSTGEGTEAADAGSEEAGEAAETVKTHHDVQVTWLLGEGVENIYAEEYEDLPAVKYWMEKTGRRMPRRVRSPLISFPRRRVRRAIILIRFWPPENCRKCFPSPAVPKRFHSCMKRA